MISVFPFMSLPLGVKGMSILNSNSSINNCSNFVPFDLILLISGVQCSGLKFSLTLSEL